ncbi:hypothetical protein [Aurantiacibacter sp. D1-12]|uniref:hypothetical protein n=1 Tax=Aurantiacibacter sp. D1-12 TaxID=2993658 RepID=UPI00237CD45F|nr:hypothetical protein [Aurantiacibacter sp. D1-12]MDE1466517.1 hypothetical protein [Aurantiacibacter sp. D1-12]
MRIPVLLPLVALTACGANNGDTGVTGPVESGYATQLEAPAPDYARILREAPPQQFDFESLRREGTGSPPVNAKQVGETWLQRLQALDLVDGYGLSGKDDDTPIASFDLRLTADDFDAWVEENGWEVPPHLRWSFVPPLTMPRVSEAAAEGIRIWPSSEQRTGLQLQAAGGGRIFLRDGCFYVQRRGQDEQQLAWFHTETGLDVDDEGYYVLVNRVSGEVEGRLGEEFIWASPNPITPGGPSMEELREACGDGEVFGVANPSAEAKMNTRYPPSAPDAMPPPGIE